MKRNRSRDNFLTKRNKEYQNYLIEQGYNKNLVIESFSKFSNIRGADLLKPKSKRKRTVTLIGNGNPNLPNIGNIIRSNLATLYSNDLMRKIFSRRNHHTGL